MNHAALIKVAESSHQTERLTVAMANYRTSFQLSLDLNLHPLVRARHVLDSHRSFNDVVTALYETSTLWEIPTHQKAKILIDS